MIVAYDCSADLSVKKPSSSIQLAKRSQTYVNTFASTLSHNHDL